METTDFSKVADGKTDDELEELFDTLTTSLRISIESNQGTQEIKDCMLAVAKEQQSRKEGA